MDVSGGFRLCFSLLRFDPQHFVRFISIRQWVRFLDTLFKFSPAPRFYIDHVFFHKSRSVVSNNITSVSVDDDQYIVEESDSSSVGEVLVDYQGCLSQCSSMTNLDCFDEDGGRSIQPDLVRDTSLLFRGHSARSTPNHRAVHKRETPRPRKKKRVVVEDSDIEDDWCRTSDEECQLGGAGDRRIEELESELARLREQIAAIVVRQETVYSATPPSQSPTVYVTRVSIPPPPPPPPPPPVASENSVSWQESLLKKKAEKQGIQAPSSYSKSSKTIPDMMSVLRGLGSVKLRSVAANRSPGGTPHQYHRKKMTSSMLDDSCSPPINNGDQCGFDAASVIARALRRKFRNVRPPSLDNSGNNTSWDEEEKENTSGLGQHLLRKVDRTQLPYKLRVSMDTLQENSSNN